MNRFFDCITAPKLTPGMLGAQEDWRHGSFWPPLWTDLLLLFEPNSFNLRRVGIYIRTTSTHYGIAEAARCSRF